MPKRSQLSDPFLLTLKADARSLPIGDHSVDLVVTSPPYYRKRDYRHRHQLGQEKTASLYVEQVKSVLEELWRVLRPAGSVFLNIGDTYNRRRSLVGVPGLVEQAAQEVGWIIRNRIIWSKTNGMPSPVRNRLRNRHEFVLHLAKNTSYYYDLHGYLSTLDPESGPADVWELQPSPAKSNHLAPFPDEIVRRAVVLACPAEVCTACSVPRTRVMKKTRMLDRTRPQARRALEIAEEAGLTKEHIAAIQATGIADAGKGLRIQGEKNSPEVRKLAAEAKKVLGGYFREFTFPKWKSSGWSDCGCNQPFAPGVVLDPFAGSGTTLRIAHAHGLSAVGADLNPTPIALDPPAEAPQAAVS